MVFKSCGLVKCDKVKEDLYHCDVCSHQTWQGGNLLWETPLATSFDASITWSCDKLDALYFHFHKICGH